MNLVTTAVNALVATGLVRTGPPARTSVRESNPRRESKPRATHTITRQYDADSEFAQLHLPEFRVFDFDSDTSPDGDPIGAVQATLYETDGRSYRLKRYNNLTDLREAISRARKGWEDKPITLPPARTLREASVVQREMVLDTLVDQAFARAQMLLREGHDLPAIRQLLREVDGFSFDGGDDGGAYTGGFQSFISGPAAVYGQGIDTQADYIPLIGGPWSKQLYLHQYLDMHRKAFEAWNHNPLAKDLINLTTYFTLGRGLDHTCTNVEVDELIREFTERTDFYAKLEVITTDLWWSGESFIEWYDNTPERGLTDFRTLDPSTIWEIVTDVEDMQNVYYAHQQYSCLDPDTRIALLDGTQPTIREMAERHAATGEHFDVYSYDLETKKIVAGHAIAAILSGQKRCVEVELDNGEVITASFDHPFLTRDGQYVLAEELRPGQSLMPLYRRRGYESVWQPETGWKHTHRVVAESVGLDISDGQHIDHVDGNSANNSPSNLQSLTRVEHVRKTWDQLGTSDRRQYGYEKSATKNRTGRKPKTFRLRDEDATRPKEWRDKIAASWTPERRAAAAERMRKVRNLNASVATTAQHTRMTPEQKVMRSAAISRARTSMLEPLVVNHKVVAVRLLEGTRDVYDLSVERYHNFALASGVFTHNTPYQQYITGVPGKNQPQAIKYIIRQIPADHFHHVKINVSAWEKRGRSDLFCVLGWLKRLKDLMNARVVKGILEGAFCWDITMQSGDADVSTAEMNLPDPFSPGSVFVHNSTIKLEAVGAHMTATGDNMPDLDALVNFITIGLTTPKEFVGVTARAGARSNSLSATEPGTKRYESRQQLIERMVHVVFDRVIGNAVKAGLLDIDDVLEDARTVKRLAVTEEDLEDRDDVKQDMEKTQADNDKKQQVANQAALAAAQPAQGSHLVNVNRDQANMKNVTPARESGGSVIKSPKSVTLNEAQTRRIKTIKKTGQYSRELVELSFPAIAQEERSAKLKDLALAEAMEWLPKSVTATMAAKEMGISTYDFQEAWALIVDEAKRGMSIAHVFGQDNKHVPEVAIAQGVQEEMQAEQPPGTQPIINVPQPPVVAGMKQEPGPGAKPGAPGSVPPGQKPNSGDTKTNLKNKHAGAPNPTAPSDGYSDAGNSPLTTEGQKRIKGKEADVLKRAIYTAVLKEAIKPMIDMRTSLARYILDREEAVAEFEESVASTEEMRTP